MTDANLIDEPASANLYDQPTEAYLIDQPASIDMPQDDGTVLVLSYIGQAGGRGQAAAVDMVVGFASFTANATLVCDFALAHPIPATAAASKAFTQTPPVSIPVVIGLLNNGVQFGTATWSVGSRFGVIAFSGPTAPFNVNDVPGFSIPAILDPAFAQFAITYASP